MSLTILKGFRHAEQFLGPGSEKTLLATNPTTEQLEGWQKRGLIEGVDTGENAVPDTLIGALRLTADEVQGQMLDILEAEVEESETPLETLNRIITERDDAENDFEDLQNAVESLAKEIPRLDGLERGEAETALDYLYRYATQFKQTTLGEGDGQIKTEVQDQVVDGVAVPITTPPVIGVSAAPVLLTAEELAKVLGSPKAAMALLDKKFDTKEKLRAATDKELEALPDLAEGRIKKLRDYLAA